MTLGVDDPAPQVESAAEFIVRTVNAAPGEITIIMVGPLTSLGEALRLDPSIAQKIRELVMLGGSIATDYDLADKPAKEANVSMDIPADKAVFASGLPILMVGLDASAMLRVDQEMLDRIENTLPVNGFLREWCRRGEFATFVPFDVMAVAMAVDRSFCEVQRGHIEIADDGYTRLVPGLADNAEYCLNPNVDAFNDFIQTRLGIDDSAIAQR